MSYRKKIDDPTGFWMMDGYRGCGQLFMGLGVGLTWQAWMLTLYEWLLLEALLWTKHPIFCLKSKCLLGTFSEIAFITHNCV